jgi:hypothetical protein
MEDVVGLKVRDAKRGWVGFVTWGRLWDAVDEDAVAEAVKPHLAGFGISEPQEILVCTSLAEIQSGQYFYEALLSFSWNAPAFGPRYEEWRNEKRAAVREGRELYFIGPLT